MSLRHKKTIDEKISEYKENIECLIINKINKRCKKYIHEPTFFGDNSEEYIENLKIAHYIRQKQMREGDISQIIIGNFIGWEDLGVGHPSGLDCRKKDNSIIMEIKNKYNTCNSGSQKVILEKLSLYKKENPDTRCIWGVVNPKANCIKNKEIIIYNNEEIEKIQGKELFKLVFTVNGMDYSNEIINHVKNIIHGS